MAATRLGRVGIIAVALAVAGGILALANEISRYGRTGVVDWGHVALAFGVPVLLYAIVAGAAARPPR